MAVAVAVAVAPLHARLAQSIAAAPAAAEAVHHLTLERAARPTDRLASPAAAQPTVRHTRHPLMEYVNN